MHTEYQISPETKQKIDEHTRAGIDAIMGVAAQRRTLEAIIERHMSYTFVYHTAELHKIGWDEYLHRYVKTFDHDGSLCWICKTCSKIVEYPEFDGDTDMAWRFALSIANHRDDCLGETGRAA